MTQVVVIEPFMIAGSTTLAIGATVDIDASLAALMVTARKARYVTAPGLSESNPGGGLTSAQVAAVAAAVGVQSGIVASQIINLGAWGQMPDGKYLTADYLGGPGQGRTALGIYAGDLGGEYDAAKLTSLANTKTLSAGVLKTAAGVNLNSAGAHIYCAWPASNGDIFFVAVEGGNFYHLFRCKAGTYTVGSDVGITNGRAVLSLGIISGTPTAQSRVFTQKSFCEAKVNGATHYYIGEYNVAAGRVNGGANDAVRVYRSTDGGTTWTVFLDWNTDGTHQVDHVHAIRQDPYTGWIYIMTGDSSNENMVIGYNGTAAAVAANATAATIAATAGYKLINGSELNRYTDLFFSPDGIYSMPDADTETSDTSSTAYVAVKIPRTLDYVVTMGPVERHDNIPPAIGLQSAAVGDFFLSFCAASGFGAYPYLDLWGSDAKGAGWTLVARLSVRASCSSRAMFIDDKNRIWIYSDSGNWFSSDADFDGSSKTRSLLLTPGARPSAPFVHTR